MAEANSELTPILAFDESLDLETLTQREADQILRRWQYERKVGIPARQRLAPSVVLWLLRGETLR